MDPLADPDYQAGRKAQEAGDMQSARSHLTLAASRNNPVALIELLDVCFGLGYLQEVRAHAAHLEQLAEESAEAAYVTSKAYETGPWLKVVSSDEARSKRKTFLLKAGGLGNPIAQMEIAANFAYGSNDFTEDMNEFKHWITLAAKRAPADAANCFAEVAAVKQIPLPAWVAKRAGKP